MIIPSFSNIEKIFETHQNQCALTQCNKKIIDSDGHVLGNIYFMESNVKGQPRYNSQLTNEQMADYHNLILLCDTHGLDVEWKERKFNMDRLRREIFYDQKTIFSDDFKLTETMMESVLQNFIEYHDPERLSHITINQYMDHHKNSVGLGFIWFSDSRYYIKPTRNVVGGKFEIIDTKEGFEKTDTVIFYPKDKPNSKGVEVDSEFKSKMSIAGITPDLSKGEYEISIIKNPEKIQKFEKNLTFSILGNRLAPKPKESKTKELSQKKDYAKNNFSKIGPIALIAFGVFFMVLSLYLIMVYSSSDYDTMPGTARGYGLLIGFFGSGVLIYAGIRAIKHSIEWNKAQD